MTTLSSSAAIDERLARLKKLRDGAHAKTAFAKRLSEWTNCAAPLSRRLDELDWFPTVEPRTTVEKQAATKARSAVAAARKRLREERSIDGLTRGVVWKNALSTLDALNDSMSTKVSVQWRLYVEAAGDCPLPEVLEARVQRSPANENVLTIYRGVYSQYEVLASKEQPESSADLKELTARASELLALQGRLDLSVPGVVGAFFREVASTNGASLSMLTDEVRDWLRLHRLLDSYVIRSRVR